MARGPMDDSPFRPNAEQLLKGGDLRDLCRADCLKCGHQWSAPVVGRCPRCASTNTTVVNRVMMNAKRV